MNGSRDERNEGRTMCRAGRRQAKPICAVVWTDEYLPIEQQDTAEEADEQRRAIAEDNGANPREAWGWTGASERCGKPSQAKEPRAGVTWNIGWWWGEHMSGATTESQAIQNANHCEWSLPRGRRQ